MPNIFTDSTDFFAPETCCHKVQVKYVVAIFQFAAIIVLIAAIVSNGNSLLEGILLLYVIASFAAFSFEQRHFMVLHAAINFIVLISFFLFFVARLLFIDGADDRNYELIDLFKLLVSLIVYVYYSYLCHRLVKSVSEKAGTSPYSLPVYIKN